MSGGRLIVAQELERVALGRIARLRPQRFTLFLIFLAVLGAVLVLLHEVTYGVALSWDSVNYIAAARNLLAGNGFTTMDGADYVAWPPLFPGLLALAGLFVLDPHEVAGLVNAVAFGLTLFVAGRWLHQRIESRFLVLWGCLAIMLQASLIQSAVWAMSEPVFILFTTLALVETEKFLNTDTRSSLVRSALFTALACLTRYVGVTIVLTVLPVLLFRGNKTLREKVRHSATYAVIAVTPLGIWLLRNMLLSGTLTDPYRNRPAFLPFLEYFQQTLDILAIWAFPLLNPLPAGATTAVGVVLLALAGTASYGLMHSCREAEPRPGWNTLTLFGAFTLIYLSFFLVAASTTPIGKGDRHFCPVYIPLLFLAVRTLDHLLRIERAGKYFGPIGRWLRARTCIGRQRRVSLVATVMAGSLALWLAGSAVVTGRVISAINGNGSWDFSWSLSRARLVQSAVLRYMRAHPVTGWVYSNDPFAVYIHTDGLANYTFVPDREQELVQVVGKWATADHEIHIVWLYSLNRHFPMNGPRRDYDHLEVRALPGVETVADLADGVILRVTPDALPERFDMDKYLANKEALINTIIHAAGEPIIRSGYDMYINANELIYIKDGCRQDDRDALFSLHWTPTDKAHLHRYWKPHGFMGLDFSFENYGVKSGNKCVAVVALPEYTISQIKTGQFVYGQKKEIVWLWRDRVVIEAAGEPIIRSGYDVYVNANELIYIKDGCRQDDRDALFSLHWEPTDKAHLSDYWREYGFNVLDFHFEEYGVKSGGKCVAVVALPEYSVSRIKTGQFVYGPDEELVWRWRESARFDD